MAGTASIIALIGPTAAGKSAVALDLAAQIGGEILSLDSMQVYRGMDIGTAKPSLVEQARVPHRLIDVVDPNESFTVARFVGMAQGVIENTSKPLVAVGGTPLYYKALFEGMFAGPGADEAIRRRLADEPPESLHERLARIDPAAAQRIHMNDRKRLVRAIEVFELTGRPISSLQSDWTSGEARYRARWFGLHWEREALNRRINARVKSMLAAGWVDEVRHLLQRFGALSKTAGEATGYHELIEHVQGRLSLDDAAEQIKIATRQLARRQMKWLRRFPNVQWLEGDQPVERVVQLMRAGNGA